MMNFLKEPENQRDVFRDSRTVLCFLDGDVSAGFCAILERNFQWGFFGFDLALSKDQPAARSFLFQQA